MGWFFYILSDLFPLIVLLLNISFTTGNVNCFVLYGQLLGSIAFNGNDSIQFSSLPAIIQAVVTFPYNSFNMNFFTIEKLSFCLWKGFTFMEAMMMNYVTVGFALVLVLMIIVITKHQCVHQKLFFRFQYRKSILIHGLSAFFILCYSQAARTTFHILNVSCLYSANLNCTVKVVHRAGHLTYFEGEHIPYAIAAVLVLLFMIVIPPLLLLQGQVSVLCRTLLPLPCCYSCTLCVLSDMARILLNFSICPNCHTDCPFSSAATQGEKAQHCGLSSICKPLSYQWYLTLLLWQD